MNVSRVRLKIFVPLATMALALLVITLTTFYVHQRKAQHSHALQHCLEIPEAFHQQLQNELDVLAAQTEAVKEQDLICAALLNRDRDELLRLAAPVFGRLSGRNRLTEMTFYDADQNSFLRVHDPQNPGEYQDNKLFKDALATPDGVSGMSLEKNGNLVLSVMQPFLRDGELQGFLEMGMGVEHVIPRVQALHGLKMMLMVDKSRVDQQSWETSPHNVGELADWDRFKTWVVAGSSMTELPKVIEPFVMDQELHVRCQGGRRTVALKDDTHYYLGLDRPLLDSSGVVIGEILIFSDIAKLHLALNNAFMDIITIGLMAISILLFLLWLYLGRIEGYIDANRAKLEQEALDHQQAMQDLKASEARIKIILNMAANGMILTDMNFTRIIDLNTTMAKMLGYTEAELKGQSPDLIHPPGAVEPVRHRYVDPNNKAIDRASDLPLMKKDGSIILADVSSSVFDLNGEQVVMGVFRDNTESRHMELQLASARKMESVGLLAAGIAHEINTPTQFVGDNIKFLKDAYVDVMAILEAYAQVVEAAKAGPVGADLVEAVEEAIEEADLEFLQEEIPNAFKNAADGVGRVTKIVRAMKEFSHPGSDGMTYANLNDAIETTTTVARNEWKYVADLDLDLDADLPAVPCNVGEFSQVMLNLIVNAAHAISDATNGGADSRGKITVSSRLVGELVEVRVTDTGGGIPDAILKRVFEPFFTTKDVGHGSGQGLAIAHAVIVKKHQGRIDIETEVGKGTTFIIRLPSEVEIAVTS